MVRRELFDSLCLIVVLTAGCSADVARPPSGPGGPSVLIEVPYPPPPARVESIPPNDDVTKVWVDGQWLWQAKRWKWRNGEWVTPPPGAYFTPWETTRKPDGKLFFARAMWRDASGRPLDVGKDPATCPAPEGPPAANVAEASP